MNETAADGFGDRLRARRLELGLSRADVAERGGPPAVTLGKLELGQTRTATELTFSRIDTALRWETGSAARLLATGAEPKPIPEQSGRSKLLTADPGAPLTSRHVRELSDVAHALAEYADAHPDERLQEVVASLRVIADRFMRTWLIAVVEDTVDNPGIAADYPLLDMVLAQFLETPPSEGLSADDRRDVTYLRWLVGKYDAEGVDREQLKQMRDRWSRRRTP